jgi:hypothetical protein
LPAISCDTAYPDIEFSPRSRNWWARLKGTAPECVHVHRGSPWRATLLPDIVYFIGRSEIRRMPLRPEVLLCRECLLDVAAAEIAKFEGRVVAFEPDPSFTQYFFAAAPDFAPVGLTPEVEEAIEKRLKWNDETCSACARPATWLWFSSSEVGSLGEVQRIRDSKGEMLCAAHGARKLRKAFEKIDQAGVTFMNLPYGEAGAYVWI